MMHTDQIVIDPDVARQMIHDQFPQYADEQIDRLETSGTVNAIFRIGSHASARFPLRASDPLTCASTLHNEAAAMIELAEHCPVPTPRPIGLGKPGPRYPLSWSVQTWIAGDIATPNGLAGSQTFAIDIANLIATLRAVSTRGRGFNGIGRGGNLPDHDEWMAVCFERSEGLLDVCRARHTWARMRKLPPAGPAVMSHKDLIPANLLVRGEHLIGVLDGGGFGPADPALDLVAVWHLLNREQRSTVQSRLGSSEAEWQRGAAWAFEQAMGLASYYQTTNPTMSALGRSTLGRILEDPDVT